MSKLFPFRGYRYDPDRIPHLSAVVTQPYDKITPEMLAEYLGRHPQNIAHVIKNPDYREAGRLFETWIAESVLRRDSLPSLYPYQQVFEFEGEPASRLGVVGLVSLGGGQLTIKGHERVMRAPLQDRLRLIRETESNDGLIFSLYSDPSLDTDRLLTETCHGLQPVAELTDDLGVSHRLWQLTDRAAQSEVRKRIDDLQLYIADGHHRFQTALQFSEECRLKGWKPVGVESYDKRMMALFNMESPGLRILPTHRAVHHVPDFEPQRLLAGLMKHFDVVEQRSLQELRASMDNRSFHLGLATAAPVRFFLLRLTKGNSDFMPGVTGTARELDVNVLHEGILKPLLGIGEDQLDSQSNVDYYRNRTRLLERLEAGQYQAAFFLNPTRIDQVKRVSEEGMRMPQKSTDFFPKLLTGLVFMKMQIKR